MKALKDFSIIRLVALCLTIVYAVLWLSFNLASLSMPIGILYFAIIVAMIVVLAIPKITKLFFVVPLLFIVYLAIDAFSMTYSYIYYFFQTSTPEYLYLIFMFVSVSIFNLFANCVLFSKALPLLWRKEGKCQALSSESFLMPGALSATALILTVVGTALIMPDAMGVSLFAPIFLTAAYFLIAKILEDYTPVKKAVEAAAEVAAAEEVVESTAEEEIVAE